MSIIKIKQLCARVRVCVPNAESNPVESGVCACACAPSLKRKALVVNECRAHISRQPIIRGSYCSPSSRLRRTRNPPSRPVLINDVLAFRLSERGEGEQQRRHVVQHDLLTADGCRIGSFTSADRRSTPHVDGRFLFVALFNFLTGIRQSFSE